MHAFFPATFVSLSRSRILGILMLTFSYSKGALAGPIFNEVYGHHTYDYPMPCENRTYFSRGQVEFCREHSSIATYMAQGAVDALALCKKEMAVELWDCVGTYDGDHGLIYVEDDGGTRESAFLMAIRAAGMVASLSRAYVEHALNCPDEHYRVVHSVDRNYENECPDVVHHSKQHVARFLEMDELPPKDLDSWHVAQHNAKVGMEVVIQMIDCNYATGLGRVYCKQRLPAMEHVARQLHNLYRKAVKVRVSSRSTYRQIEELIAPNWTYPHWYDNLAYGHVRNTETPANVRNLKLYYLVDSESYQGYCKRRPRSGRTCFRTTTKENFTSDDVHHVELALRSCKFLCCNDTFTDTWIRYTRQFDETVAVEHVCH